MSHILAVWNHCSIGNIVLAANEHYFEENVG